MEKVNLWELAKKEADVIINAIKKGEVHTLKEIHDYLDPIYSYSFYTTIMSIVNTYTSLNNIEMPWDNE